MRKFPRPSILSLQSGAGWQPASLLFGLWVQQSSEKNCENCELSGSELMNSVDSQMIGETLFPDLERPWNFTEDNIKKIKTIIKEGLTNRACISLGQVLRDQWRDRICGYDVLKWMKRLLEFWTKPHISRSSCSSAKIDEGPWFIRGQAKKVQDQITIDSASRHWISAAYEMFPFKMVPEKRYACIFSSQSRCNRCGFFDHAWPRRNLWLCHGVVEGCVDFLFSRPWFLRPSTCTAEQWLSSVLSSPSQASAVSLSKKTYSDDPAGLMVAVGSAVGLLLCLLCVACMSIDEMGHDFFPHRSLSYLCPATVSLTVIKPFVAPGCMSARFRPIFTTARSMSAD